ncbi:MAG: lipopolysaccharide heptosyltransferase II [Candidatus Wallbacteria bacterium GWC2_49_35]|uniref:lipopolysaccharide heptosyltransferase II n=1 Tax=Candidatus Wallbacteria bacterium GWC2_49_35 TaxID=1817813 RepID=A0A1F7WP97_9BACT|nr:MAG: lipopolysaccharide heptosyltransferase II [Candidatus Wallbacteria bacterium GWC2_49_35]HBC73935.1 lipopolysaccharide heptosyltransferase II [Candidatus Wallbacteria bacterium]
MDLNIRKYEYCKYKKILVRSTNWLGDAVMSTPFFAMLREMFPNAFIEAAALDYIAPVFENNPAINKISVVRRAKGVGALTGAISAFLPRQSFEYDLGISLPNSIGAALDLKKAGCREIIGYNRGGRGFILTGAVGVTKEILCVHEIYYYMNLLRRFANDDSHPAVTEVFSGIASGLNVSYKLYLTPDEIARAKGTLAKIDILCGRDIILGINPGAFFGPAKRWFTDRYAETAAALCERFGGLKILVFGSGKEESIGSLICRNLPGRAFNMCGKTTIRELMALISMCGHFLTNDSGAMHIAAAFDVPVTAVFGPTDHKSTYPLSRRFKIIRREVPCAPCKKRECPKGHHLCMKNIDVKTVVDSLSEELEKLEINNN